MNTDGKIMTAPAAPAHTNRLRGLSTEDPAEHFRNEERMTGQKEVEENPLDGA